MGWGGEEGAQERPGKKFGIQTWKAPCEEWSDGAGKRKEKEEEEQGILMNSLIAASLRAEKQKERLSELCFSWVACGQQI